jgi:tetratricopeptide (TPR) repeat protein
MLVLLSRPVRPDPKVACSFSIRICIIFCLVFTLSCSKKITRTIIGQEIERVSTRVSIGESGPDELKEKGVKLAKAKKYEDAIAAFKAYLDKEPENFFGFNALAVCYKNLGDHENAMKNFNRALEIANGPEQRAKVLANIGNLYSAANNHQSALGYYKDAARESEENPYYLILIAQTFLKLGEPDRAKKVLSQVEATSKNSGKYEQDEEKGLSSFLLAKCYASLGEEDKVLKYLEQAFRANPSVNINKVDKEVSDERSVLYSLKDDERLERILRKYGHASGRKSSD